MSQNDYVIANQTTPLFRSDLNSALQALASNSSGATAPTTTYANMLWYDTTTNILKMRTEADDAWINVGYLDQSSNAFRIFDDTQVVDTSGTQTGLIGSQSTAIWEAGTSTTESLVSPAKVRAAAQGSTPAEYIYDYQEFTVSGTWTKPTNAATGDKVFVEMCGGGGSGAIDANDGDSATGGGGIFYVFDNIDNLGATEAVVIGAGGAARTSFTTVDGFDGGATTFGTSSTEGFLSAGGGEKGTGLQQTNPASSTIYTGGSTRTLSDEQFNSSISSPAGNYGGGAGGVTGGPSNHAGRGGDRGNNVNAEDGEFPGGGGGTVINRSSTRTSGAGADGRLRVWCVKETA